MAKLQGFRLVNIHANQNTIVYPDTYFEIDGKNALIDMKNGGGKTLAAQMLFQTILPNSYFNEKNQISSLFTGVTAGSTIHCVSEFSIEGQGFKQLILGFSAVVDPAYEQSDNNDTIRIKYMSYIIAGNNLTTEKLTATTLPLSKSNNGQITAILYKDLKSYLSTKTKDKKHQEQYVIEVFENERNRYYQQLRKYGINAEVFDFLREINRDENYIRQFFEQKCKRPRDLLLNFIISNTEKALNAKMFMSQLDKVDPTAQLADSLFEKSQSIIQLNNVHKDIASYQMIQNEVTIFQDFVKSKESGLKVYDNHLDEYKEQTVLYMQEVDQCKQIILDLEEQLELKKEKQSNIEKELEWINIRELQIKKQELENELNIKQEHLLNQQNQIQDLETERTKLESINLIIDYKEHQAEKNSIEEKLEKLTAVHYDEKRITSGFANTICYLGEQAIQSLNQELTTNELENAKDAKQISNLQREGGKLELQKNQNKQALEKTINKKNISEKDYKKLVAKWQEIDIIQEITDNEQETLKNLELNNNNAILDTTKILEEEKFNIQKQISQMEKLQMLMEERQMQLEDKQKWIVEYEKSLANVQKIVWVKGKDLQENYTKLKEEIDIHTKKYLDETKKQSTIEEEIQVLEDYGFLRNREKYDAKNILQEDLNYAEFGSDILRKLDQTQVNTILEKFPGFAEVLVISDEDYKKIATKKYTVSKTIARENFVIMPWSSIGNLSGDFSFESLYLLTLDGEYYKGLLDPKEAITKRKQQLTKIEQKLSQIQEEKNQMNVQLELLSEHLHRYPEVTVSNYISEIERLNQKITDIKTMHIQAEQKWHTHKLAIEKYTDDLKKLQQEQIKIQEATKILLEKLNLREIIVLLEQDLENLLADEVVINKNLEQNQAHTNLLEKTIDQRSKAIERIKQNKSQYLYYIEQAKGYEDKNIPMSDQEDITNLFRRFEVAKRKFDIEAENYDELMSADKRLAKLLQDIKNDYRFTKFDFEQMYSNNYVDKTEKEEFNAINFKLDEMNKAKLNLEKEKNKRDANYQMAKTQYEKVANKITLEFMAYENLTTAVLEDKKRYASEMLDTIIKQITANEQELKKQIDFCNNQEQQLQMYKVFCDSHNLDFKNSVKAEVKIPYNKLYEQFESVKRSYENTISKINQEIRRLEALCEKLSIDVQFKQKLRNALTSKKEYSEIINLYDTLEKTSNEITRTIENLEISIANIGKLDEEIASQVFRLLKTILDEICKIPSYSKFKYDDYTRESFRMNLTEENGARIDNEIVYNNIKNYVYELAYKVEKENLTKKDIKNQLSIYNLIPFGVDLQRLSIQILKIDQDRPKYYNWDRLSASSGQGYVTYVMFAITMIKYFNSVTTLNDKMVAPIFLFLDNPFGSASDIQLWEPVRRFLDKSNAQLLCVAHNVPPAGQILFDKHILMEQGKNEKGQLINMIRNEKVESKTIIQKKLLEHQTIL